MTFARRLAVRPWMLYRPMDGADGRLANHPGSPFGH